MSNILVVIPERIQSLGYLKEEFTVCKPATAQHILKNNIDDYSGVLWLGERYSTYLQGLSDLLKTLILFYFFHPEDHDAIAHEISSYDNIQITGLQKTKDDIIVYIEHCLRFNELEFEDGEPIFVSSTGISGETVPPFTTMDDAHQPKIRRQYPVFDFQRMADFQPIAKLDAFKNRGLAFARRYKDSPGIEFLFPAANLNYHINNEDDKPSKDHWNYHAGVSIWLMKKILANRDQIKDSINVFISANNVMKGYPRFSLFLDYIIYEFNKDVNERMIIWKSSKLAFNFFSQALLNFKARGRGLNKDEFEQISLAIRNEDSRKKSTENVQFQNLKKFLNAKVKLQPYRDKLKNHFILSLTNPGHKIDVKGIDPDNINADNII